MSVGGRAYVTSSLLSRLRQFQYLPGVDEIGILDDVLIGLIEGSPLGGVPIDTLSNLGEIITCEDGIRTASARRRDRAWSSGRTAALHVGKIRFRFIVCHRGPPLVRVS